MKVVHGHRGFEEMVADYVLEQFPNMAGLVPGGTIKPYRAVAFVDDKNVMHGGLVMSDYKGFDAQVSIYVDTQQLHGLRPFATVRALQELMRWTFNEVGLTRVTCLIDPKNKRSRRFAEKMGFKLEGKLRHGLDGKSDALVYGMLRDDARYLKD